MLSTRRHSRARQFVLALLVSTIWTVVAPPMTGMAQVPAETARVDTSSYSITYDAEVVVRAGRSVEKIVTTRVKILGEAALQNAGQQARSFTEGMETLDIVEAYTEKADGRKITVDPANIITRDRTSGTQMLYLDVKTRTIIYPDLAVGDTVVLKVRQERKSSVFPGHYYDGWFFSPLVPYAESTVRLTVPKELALNIKVEGAGLERETSEDESTVRHRITYRPQPRQFAETGAIAAVDHDPRLLVSTFKNFLEMGAAYWAAAAPRAEVTPEIQALADEITKGIGDRRAQAVAIDAWVKRSIRYVAVYLGAARVVPNPAATVLKHKYGDCKDHVTLMSTLLAAKGIATEQVLIQSGNAYTLPEPATMSYINHVILYLPEFGVYNDPTSSFAAFGVLSSGTYDKPVIHTSAAGARAARTPAMQPDEHITTNRTKITIAVDGTVSGETIEITTGVFASGSRSAATQIQHNGLESAAERQLRANGTLGKGRFELVPPSNLAEPYTMRGRFTLNERAKIVSGGSHVIPAGLTIKVRPGESLFNARYEGRKQPFQCFAGRQIEEIEVTFADGLALPRPLKGRTIENRWFSYTADYRLEDRTLKVRREFTSKVPAQVCTPDVEQDIGALLKDVHGSVRTRMSFQPAPEVEPKTPDTTAAPPADPARSTTTVTPAPGLD